MKKTICCVGSSGFIGRQIYSDLKDRNEFEIFRFSSRNNQFIDRCDIKKFDYLIFTAGVHNKSEDDAKDIFFESKKILRNTKQLFFNSDSIVYISSFKTSINTNEKIIKSSNKYNYYEYDNYYGKSKIIFEKIFIKFCKNFKKKFTIICPTHVIGPGDTNLSANGKFFQEILNKKIIFFPNCKISIVDVRNLSQKIKDIVIKDEFENLKIIINDKSLDLEDYIKEIKLDKKKYFTFKLNFFLIKILFILNNLLIMSKLTKKNIISKNRLKYIEINPIAEVNDKNKKFNFKETVHDTKIFFSNK